jgi:hypothetical protein
MAAIGLLHGVHGQRANRVDAELFEVLLRLGRSDYLLVVLRGNTGLATQWWSPFYQERLRSLCNVNLKILTLPLGLLRPIKSEAYRTALR